MGIKNRNILCIGSMYFTGRVKTKVLTDNYS